MVGAKSRTSPSILTHPLAVLDPGSIGYNSTSSGRPKKVGRSLAHSHTSRRLAWVRLKVSVFGLTLTTVRTT